MAATPCAHTTQAPCAAAAPGSLAQEARPPPRRPPASMAPAAIGLHAQGARVQAAQGGWGRGAGCKAAQGARAPVRQRPRAPVRQLPRAPQGDGRPEHPGTGRRGAGRGGAVTSPGLPAAQAQGAEPPAAAQPPQALAKQPPRHRAQGRRPRRSRRKPWPAGRTRHRGTRRSGAGREGSRRKPWPAGCWCGGRQGLLLSCRLTPRHAEAAGAGHTDIPQHTIRAYHEAGTSLVPLPETADMGLIKGI